MQVVVYNHLDNNKQIYEGSDEEVKSSLFKDHPFLLHRFGCDAPIEVLVKDLDRNQMTSAVISSICLTKSEIASNNPQLYNKDEYLESIRAAVEFLSGIKVSDLAVRQALLAYDGDDMAAMLDVHNLTPSKANLGALEAVLAASLNKSEADAKPVTFNKIEAFNESGAAFAKLVERASKTNNIHEVNLGKGKHSKGTLVAKDPESHLSLVLKPGSGKQNPALGEGQNPASQSTREAAFYAIACAWGLGKYLPECHLLLLDGQGYAAMQYLGEQWVNGNDLRAQEPNKARRLLHMYLVDGTIHKWAALDYVGGNSDRHSGNLMYLGPEVRLIDHGSALAGIDFRPPVDKYSFVPCYLREFCPPGFGKLDAHAKLLKLPRGSNGVGKELTEWLQKLDGKILQKLLIGYDVDPAPCMARLEFLKTACGIQPADLAINGAWVVT